jgi:hypothetical protein
VNCILCTSQNLSVHSLCELGLDGNKRYFKLMQVSVLRCFSFGICQRLFRDLLTEKLNFIYVYETVDCRLNVTKECKSFASLNVWKVNP